MKETARLQNIHGNISGGPRVSLYITTMIRTFLLLLVAGLVARASDPIQAPVGGTSVPVTQPHVVAELIPETTAIEPGKPFDIALHLHMDPGWHTYWINPGDAGLATTIDWTLPPGFTAGPIQWPTPEKHTMGPLIIYGYGGDAYLLTTITPPKADLPQHFDVKAKAGWLVCQEECIPGKADLTLPLDSGLMNLRLPINNTDFFAQARERMPVPNTFWDIAANYIPLNKVAEAKTGDALLIQFSAKKNDHNPAYTENIYFFPEQPNVLSPQEAGDIGSFQGKPAFWWIVPLQQNGEKPQNLSGVLFSDPPLDGKNRSIYISSFLHRRIKSFCLLPRKL